jgi:glycosyltransferase involved in cell wall biosynthesis
MKSKISIIVPVYNRENFIGRCIRSLLSQTLSREVFDIIVIDDGSTDDTSKILFAFKEEIKWFRNKNNQGLSSAINLGIKKSKSEYIVRVDSDDYVNKDFLKVLYLFAQHNKEIDAFACDYITVNQNEKVLKRENCLKKPIACGILFKRKHLKEIGFYNAKKLINEEKDLRKRFIKKYKISRISLPLYRYKKHINSLTGENEY